MDAARERVLAGLKTVLAIVIGGWLLRIGLVNGVFPVTYSEFSTALGHPWVRPAIVQVLVLASLLYLARKPVKALLGRSGAPASTGPSPSEGRARPGLTVRTRTIRTYSVDQPARYGLDEGGQGMSAPARPPRCPDDGMEMEPSSESGGDPADVDRWRCRRCERVHRQPRRRWQ